MKKIIVIILLIIGALFLVINYYNNSSIKKNPVNTKDSVKGNNREESTEPIPPEIPEIYDFASLEIETKFRPVKINLPDTLRLIKKNIDLSIIVPVKNQFCDVFLLINSVKKDMFYQISEGSYEFKNVPLTSGLNEIEIFYRIGRKRSQSSSCVIIRN